MTRSFSAPGKALLAGGYLVLDKQFKSYVVALSARMHAIVDGELTDAEYSTITVKSPQFKEGEWSYTIDQHFKIVETNGRKNPFAESTVLTVFAYMNPVGHSNITITIFSDPSYHSQEGTIAKKSRSKKFHYHLKPIYEVAKTGLGSSAGLVTVLVTALLSYYTPQINFKDHKQLQLIHNLAQVAHCQAQGKVGSGFDVAAATFGSITYRRFEPLLISGLKPLLESNAAEYHQEIEKLVKDTDWDIQMQPVGLPNGIKLLMGDIRGGSNTPKLVSKVLAWRSNDPKSESIFAGIDHANMAIVECLSALNIMSKESPELYQTILKAAATLDSETILNSKDLVQLKKLIEANRTIRSNFKYITRESGAEIEPEEQTRLLDRCSQIPGVLASVVPGAGGYDAVCVLIVEGALEAFYRATQSDAMFSNVTWMDLREEDEGVLEEDPSEYFDLL
jgi:phosphomevalonate kinase